MDHHTITTQSIEGKHPGRHAAFWITLARSILALALGLALILQPEKSRPFLLNFIGLFWFMAGLMNLRWGASGERARRTSVVVGVVGSVAGVLVLGMLVLIWHEDFGPIFYAVATLWAFVGAFMLRREALARRAGFSPPS